MAWHVGLARAGEGPGATGHHARAASVPALAVPTATETLKGRSAPPPVPGPAHAHVEVSLTPEDQEAMGRVAFAEAGNQGAEGLAGVIFTILNRLHGGRWGATIPAVVDAPGQFEPVMRAGGTWERLPALTPGQTVEYETILHLILEGRVPDPTNGALYFQNPTIVAERAAAGEVSAVLVNFGGETPSATIRDQVFYRTIAPGLATAAAVRRPAPANLFATGNAPRLFAPDQGEGATPAGLFVPAERTDTMAAPLALPAALTGRVRPVPAPPHPPAEPASSPPTGPEASAP
jgi:cell wall hydrolase